MRKNEEAKLAEELKKKRAEFELQLQKQTPRTKPFYAQEEMPPKHTPRVIETDEMYTQTDEIKV